MEAIVGDMPDIGDRHSPDAVQREDGSWLVDGLMHVKELRRRFAMPTLPGEEDEDFETLAGFVADRLGRIPKTGEHFTVNGWRFEVVDMDGKRIDKILASHFQED